MKQQSSKNLYLVWYDPKLGEVINVEKEHATHALLVQLRNEYIEICEIHEESLKKANELYLHNIESLVNDINIMISHHEIGTKYVGLEADNDAVMGLESYSINGFDLDTRLDEIAQPIKKRLKFH